MNSPFLQFPDYTIVGKIDQGSFASVFKAIRNDLQFPVALKVFSKQSLKDPDNLQVFKNEERTLKNVNHPLLCSLYDVVENEFAIAFVLEYLEGGSLLNYINGPIRMTVNQGRIFFQQLISALEYLHLLGVVHRDLKLENLLIDINKNLRIIDFGFAKPASSQTVYTTICGSPAYTAPEILTTRMYTESVDLWSAGIILYAITHARLPFSSNNTSALFRMIQEDSPKINSKLDPNLKQLLEGLLDKDPKTRLTFSQIHENSWFQGKHDPTFIYNDINVYPATPDLPLDPEILDILESRNYKKQIFIDGIQKNEFNSTLALYRILRRDKINTLFNKKIHDPTFSNETNQSDISKQTYQILNASRLNSHLASTTSSIIPKSNKPILNATFKTSSTVPPPFQSSLRIPMHTASFSVTDSKPQSFSIQAGLSMRNLGIKVRTRSQTNPNDQPVDLSSLTLSNLVNP